MPFSNKRNSRDDNSKRSRGNTDDFRSNSGRSSNFNKKSSFDKKKPNESSSFGRDNRNTSRPRNEENGPYITKDRNTFRSNDSERSFGKNSGERSSYRKEGFNEKSSYATRDKTDKPYYKKNNSTFQSKDTERSFGKDKNERSSYRNGERSTFQSRDGERSFRKENKSFDPKKPHASRAEREDRPFDKKRSFDKPFKTSYKKFDDSDSNRSFNAPRNSDEKRFVKRSRNKSESISKDDGLIRLNRYIANAGICSRRKADELISAGVISVNGVAVTELGTKVDPTTDEIRYNDERLKREKMVYVLLNKPKDYITTTDDPQERHTVMELVSKATKERIYPVGRLDRNTTGLLLMTNDGNLAEKLSHPRNNISKIYNIELNKNLTQGDFNKIAFGLELEDGFVKPDDLSYVQGGSKREVGIQIHSGKNRIVRRIFESLGYEVVKLDRVVYANLTKKDLPRGRWRYLEEREIIQLKHLI